MAYAFAAGSLTYLDLANCGGVSNYPCTLFVRAKSSDLANNQIIATYIRETGTYNGLLMWAAGGNAGDPFQIFGTNSAVSYADGNWHGVVGIGNSNSSQTQNVDNVAANAAVSINFEGYSAIQLGGRLIPGFQNALTGAVCCAALWTVALTAEECRSLHAGFSPRRIRPQSLLAYGPLVRDLQAVVNRNAVTASFGNHNTSAVVPTPHPRSYGF